MKHRLFWQRIAAGIVILCTILIYTDMPLSLAQVDKGDVLALDWNPDGNRLAIGYSNAGLEVWDAHNEQIILTRSNPDRIATVAWSPEGDRLAVTPGNGGVIDIIDPETNTDLYHLHIGQGFVSSISSLSWSPDGNKIAAATQSGLGMTTQYHLRIWNIATGLEITYPEPVIKSVLWSPDGSQIAITNGGFPGTSTIVNVNTGSSILTIPDTILPWSPDGNKVATSTIGVSIWDANTGEIEQTLGLEEPVTSNDIAWSPDGAMVASGSWYGRLDVWDTQSWQPIVSIPDFKVGSIGWNPEGSQLAYYAYDSGGITVVIQVVPIVST